MILVINNSDSYFSYFYYSEFCSFHFPLYHIHQLSTFANASLFSHFLLSPIRHHSPSFSHQSSLSSHFHLSSSFFLLPPIITHLPSSIHHHSSSLFHPSSPVSLLPSFIPLLPSYQYNAFTSKVTQHMGVLTRLLRKSQKKIKTSNSYRSWDYSIRCLFYFFHTFLFLCLGLCRDRISITNIQNILLLKI